MKKFQSHLMLVILFSLTESVWSSALFEDTAANLWLVDTDSGEVTSYGFGDWLTSYKQAQGDLPLPSSSYQALVNSLPSSSESMTEQQPGVSIISLSEAQRQLGSDTGPNLLNIVPTSGSYADTIGVLLRVEPRQLIAGNRTLRWRWRLNNGSWQTWQSRTLTQKDQEVAGSSYIETPLFFVRDGLYELEAELLHQGNIIARIERVYDLITDDPLGENRDTDGDGVPDLVEQALGLNPLNKDLDSPSHIEGWSRFDLWLRCEEAVLSNCTKPADTDQDGWTDVDEMWRGTEPEDVIVSYFIAAPEVGSEEERQLRRHFQEFPAARRLYEVEYKLGEEPMGLVPEQLTAASLTGQSGWQISDLVGTADLENAMLTADDVAPSRLLSQAETALGKDLWPSLRIPAADAVVLRANQKLERPEGIARQNDLVYLPPKADLEPNGFNVEDIGSWVTANDWKGHYQSWLQTNLVAQVQPEFEQTTSHTLLALEHILAEEARLRGISDQAKLGVPGQRLSWLSELQADIEHRSPGVTLSQLIAGLEATFQPDGLLSKDATTIIKWLEAIPVNLNSSAWLQQNLALNQDLSYRLRLMLLGQGAAQLTNDNSLYIAANDSDGDGLTNAEEISQAPYRHHTLPWASDTDNDSYADGSDLCPLDPYNGCTGSPDENQLMLGSHLSVSKPATEGTVLLSVQLDRPAVAPVTISYQIWAANGDSAVDGEDFIASSGQVVIQPGQNTVLIPVTLLNGGNGEQFRLEIVSVDGAQIAGSTFTLVGLTAYDPQAPVAKVMATNLIVNETQSLILDASASYDPNGNVLNFAWQQAAGSTVTLDTGADIGFAEFIAPNLAASESITFAVTVSNDSAQTDSAQINVLVVAEDEPPKIVSSVVYEHSRQGVLNIPLQSLKPLISDPEGGELSFDHVVSEPNGSSATLVGSNLVIDGNIAKAWPLGTQGGESNSLVPWRGNGFAFLTWTAAEGEGPRLYGWQPDDGLEMLFEGEEGESFSNLVADPIFDRLYFDRSIGSTHAVSWLNSDGSIDDVTVTRNFMGNYIRQPNSLHKEGGLYLCSTDNNSWFYLDAKAQTVTDLNISCGYTSVTQQNSEQVCLASTSNMFCTVPGSTSSNPTVHSSFMESTLISSEKLGDTLLFLVESTDTGVTKLLRYKASDGLVLLHKWNSSSIGYDLNTVGDRLIMVAGLRNRIEVISWQEGAANVTVHGSNYFNDTGETYSYLSPLQMTESGELYWLVKTGTHAHGVHQFNFKTDQFDLIRSLDLDQSPIVSAYGYQLALSPRGLVLATEHTDGFCYWQRLSANGDLAPAHLEAANCNAKLVNEQVEVHLNEDDVNRRYYRVSGGDFVGSTLVQLSVSDPAGNSVILEVNLNVIADIQ